jgi:hypothetical protein
MERWLHSRVLVAIALLATVSGTASAEFFGRSGLVNRSILFPFGIFSNQLDNNQFTPTGFSNVVQKAAAGAALNLNNLFEKTNTGFTNQLIAVSDRFGGVNFVARNLFNGRIQLPEADTIRDLRELILTQFDQLGARDQVVGAGFIRNTGGLGQGFFGNTLFLDTSSGTLPAYARNNPTAIAAIINMLFNAVSQSATLISVNPGNIFNGLIGLNLLPFFRPQALALMARSSYSCGNPRIPPRLDEMADAALGKDYYQLVGVPKTIREFEGQLGVRTDFTGTAGNGTVITGSRDETLVGAEPSGRVLKWQPTRRLAGGLLWQSYDFSHTAPAGAQTDSRNPFRHPLNFNYDAGEFIFTAPNGMQRYALYNAAGQRQDEAPASVALGKSTGALKAPVVENAVACMQCHVGGSPTVTGYSANTGYPYTENLGRIPGFARAFYGTLGTYRQVANIGKNIFMNAMIRSRSYIPDPGHPGNPRPLLPDIVGGYRADVDMTEAAREFAPILGFVPNPQLVQAVIRQFGLPITPDGKVRRNEFATNFCNLASVIARGGRGGGFLAGGGRGFGGRAGGGIYGYAGLQHTGPPGVSARPVIQ